MTVLVLHSALPNFLARPRPALHGWAFEVSLKGYDLDSDSKSFRATRNEELRQEGWSASFGFIAYPTTTKELSLHC